MHQLYALRVPEFNFEAIKRRAEAPRRLRRRIFAAVGLGTVAPALAFAALQFVHFDVTHKYGMWQVYPPRHTSTDYRNPTQATLEAVAKRARYHVVWPAGMPGTSILEALDDDASQMFTLVYTCPGTPRGYSAAVIIPKDYSAINPDLGAWFFSQKIPHGRVLKWNVRDQLMLVESTCLSSEQIARVRAATIAAGAEQR